MYMVMANDVFEFISIFFNFFFSIYFSLLLTPKSDPPCGHHVYTFHFDCLLNLFIYLYSLPFKIFDYPFYSGEGDSQQHRH